MGSFHDVLHGRKGVQFAQPGPVLDWMQRVRIAIGASKGPGYLHDKVQPSIIHLSTKWKILDLKRAEKSHHGPQGWKVWIDVTVDPEAFL